MTPTERWVRDTAREPARRHQLRALKIRRAIDRYGVDAGFVISGLYGDRISDETADGLAESARGMDQEVGDRLIAAFVSAHRRRLWGKR